MRQNRQLLPQMQLSIIALSVLLPLLWASPSDGQSTSITSSGLNTVITQGGTDGGRQNYNVTGGTRPGNGPNLFHSFGDFSVDSTSIARFLNDTGLSTSNILSRVTGGNPSNIFGEINTNAFPGANLYLINPAGVVFGPTAILNVGGSVKISTADYLRLADGIRFNAVPGAQDALLSTAPVAAFGFLKNTPRPISVEGSTLDTQKAIPNDPARSLTLVGGDIDISGGTLKAAGGISIVSVASRGEVRTGTLSTGITNRTLGTVTMVNSALDTGNSHAIFDSPFGSFVSPRPAGPLEIRGGQLVMDHSTLSAAGVPLPGDEPRSGPITVSVSDTIRAADSHIATGGTLDGRGAVSLEAGKAIHLSSSTVEANNVSGAIPAGSVAVNAPVIHLDGSQINARGDIFRADEGGLITLQGNRVHLENGSRLNASNGGTVVIDAAATARLDQSTVEVSAIPEASRPGGNILISAGEAVRLNESDLSAAGGFGNGGNILIDAGTTFVIRSSSVSATSQTGNGGNLFIRAPQAARFVDSSVSTSTGGDGAGGNIAVDANIVSLRNHTSLQSTAVNGPGGTITIRTNDFRKVNSSVDAASQFGPDGSVTIQPLP